jgi:hypothetical protein
MAEAKSVAAVSDKRAWLKPELQFDGDLRDLVMTGGGKLTSTGGDGGESRKQPPSG